PCVLRHARCASALRMRCISSCHHRLPLILSAHPRVRVEGRTAVLQCSSDELQLPLRAHRELAWRLDARGKQPLRGSRGLVWRLATRGKQWCPEEDSNLHSLSATGT